MKAKKLIVSIIVITLLQAIPSYGIIPVVTPATDIFNQVRALIVDLKNEYQWAIDLKNQITGLYNDFMLIQNQLTQIQQQYDAVTNFDPSTTMKFMQSLEQSQERMDVLMNQTEGLLSTSGNLEDKMNATIPRAEGLSELNPDQWKDFFAASEKEKKYSVKNAIKDYSQIRKNYALIKAKQRELEDQNNQIQNPVQAARLTNEILLQQQEQLKELQTHLGNQAMIAATGSIAADNTKGLIEAETKRVMTFQPAPVTNKGAGLFQLD